MNLELFVVPLYPPENNVCFRIYSTNQTFIQFSRPDPVVLIVVGTGKTCIADEACEIGETCDMNQGDFNENDIGDACECYADIDGDSNVYPSDLMTLIDEYGRTDCCTNPPCLADINDDCNVFPSDLMILIEEYGNTGCPVIP